MYISPYRCIQQGHRLEWFQQITKKEGFEGGWFICRTCTVQSAWIRRECLPPSVDWHLLYERERPDFPFIKKANGQPNDYALLTSKPVINCAKPEAKPEPTELADLQEKLANVTRHRDQLLLRVEKLQAELVELRRQVRRRP